ncbi:MAG: hypothetical protein WCA08_08670 [Desulfoferrobacter sp.]
MRNLATSWQQMSKQRATLQKKTSKLRALARQRHSRSEEYLLKKLSKEMGVDLGKILEEIEKRADADRESLQPQLDKLRADVKHFAVQNRRRLDQAIKTYAKRGIIKGFHKLYPNEPNMRMKFAFDWEGFHEPPGVPGMGSEYGLSDISFDQELDASGAPFVVEGHDGLCKKFRAYCHACAGDRKVGYASASSTQTLVFSHDPPSMDADMCGFSELWVPMSLTGTNYVCKSDAGFLSQTLAFSGGGYAEIRLAIRVEQDTEHELLLYPIVDQVIYSDADWGSVWILGALFGGELWATNCSAHPINLLLDEPYRLPPMTLLYTDQYGGGEVRVIVTLSCRTTAEHRHAEAEIDLSTTSGFGVEIHEVFLRGAGCVGHF